MKKNYNYAYENLQLSGAEAKIRLDPNILAVIADSKLNQKSLDSLNVALDIIKIHTTHNPKKPIKIDASLPPEEQLANYQRQVLEDYSPEEPLTSAKSQYLVAERMLERYRDDFQRLLNDVYFDIKNLCEQNKSSALRELLSESPWIKAVLSEHDDELGILGAQKGFSQILEIIYPEVQDDKQNLLAAATKAEQIDCIKYLLGQNADPAPLLGTEAYNNNEQIVNLFAEMLNQKCDIRGEHYKGMFLYKQQRYDEAIKSFQIVIDSKADFAVCALLYQGFCHQYSKNYNEAKEVFIKVLSGESTYYDIVNIRDLATKHLKGIEAITTGEQKRVEQEQIISKVSEKLTKDDTLQDIIPNDFNQQLKSYFASLRKGSTQDVTQSFKELQTVLDDAKYIKIRSKFSEKVLLAVQFDNIKGLFEQITSQFTEQDQKALHDYNTALAILDETTFILGDISTGLVVEGL